MPLSDRAVVFAAGTGVIEPTGEFRVSEIIEASDKSQKPVEDPHVVCIDERNSVEGKQPVREKVAAGNLGSALFAVGAVGWAGLTDTQVEAGPEVIVGEIADHLMDGGEKLGAHRHKPLHDHEKTGCGSVDQANGIESNIAEHASDELWIKQAKIDLGDNFDLDNWHRAQIGYERMTSDLKWQKFRKALIQETVAAKGGVVETLNGENDAFKNDPDNLRHNHWAQGAKINGRKGYSNDRDNADIPTFQVDVDPLTRIAKIFSNNAKEYSLMLHALLQWQYGTTYSLTKNMLIIR